MKTDDAILIPIELAIDMKNIHHQKLKAIQQILDAPFAGRGLTPREEEIATWLGWGYTRAEIAELENISSETVKTHSHNISKKLKIPARKLPHLLIMQLKSVLKSGGGK